MQIVLRFLPQILIVVALAVVTLVVARRLPKTAKLEAELALSKAAEKSAGGGLTKPARTKPAVLRSIGKAGGALGRGVKVAGRATFGRLGKVLKIAQRKRAAAPVSGSVLGAPTEPVATGTGPKQSVAAAPVDEKQKAIIQLLKEAEDYARQANWQAAEKVYIKVVALAPKTLEAYLGLGNLYLKQKNWNDAAEAYKVVLESDHDNINAVGNLGQALANKGEWVAAAEMLARAAKLDPGNAVRHATLGLAYMTIKDYKKAIKAYREAMKHDRDNLAHKIELAKAAHAVGDKALAEETLTSILTRDPLHEQAKTLLSEVRSKKELE